MRTKSTATELPPVKVYLTPELREKLRRLAIQRSEGRTGYISMGAVLRDFLEDLPDGVFPGPRRVREYGRTRKPLKTGCSPQPVPASNPATEQDTPLPEAIGWR